jgi:tetratricopeptide (TPR) repeat protein
MTDDRDRRDPAHPRSDEAVTEAGGEPPRDRLPEKIGQFHIKGVLASGGMGVVYSAVQEHPRRTVAVKVMKHGIASRSAMRRFEYESQVLARLRHPGIAQVYEAGTHDDGSGAVPYFAMEYVPNAKPITQFVRDKALGTRERLKLFARVCDAVHHGHQKGVIHRDLKPDNILVDPNGDVKIIDFGVARGTDSDLALTTLQTEVGQLIGTLQYMSPEQCEAHPDAIDARSDVYALGVVLFELLVGRLPYTISGQQVLHATEVIREHAPTRPSTIDRSLRGDVETIVLSALEKDPQRRYPSASDFAQDLRAYLKNEAIRARPPSAVYQVRLFARRHRFTLAMVASLVVIVGTAAFLVVGSHRRALQAEMAASSARDGAPAKQRATDMIGEVPAEFSLTTMDGKPVGTAEFADYKATVLNFVAADCPYCLKQVPLVERIREEYEPKGVRFVNVVQHLIKEYTTEEAADVFTQLGSRIELANGQPDDVKNLFKVAGYPSLCILDRSGTVKHAVIGAHSDLMTQLRCQLDSLIHGIPTPEEALAEAEKLHRQTLESNRQTLGEGHRDTLQAMENLAANLTEQGKRDEAETLYREMLNIRRDLLGENDPQTLESMHRLAVVLHERGKPAEAEVLHRQLLAARQQMLGPDDPATRLSMAHLGMALQAQDKTEGAAPYIAELIELRRRAAQAQDADADALNEYSWLLLSCEPEELRDPATALEFAQEAVRLSGRQDALVLDTLAVAQRMNGDLRAAIETQKEAITLLAPSEFVERAPLEKTLAELYKEAGDFDGLEEWYRDSLARTRSSMPAVSLAVGLSLGRLGDFLLERERYEEAEPVLREVVDIARTALPENHWRISYVESTLGRSLIGQARYREAEPLVVDAYMHILDNPRVPGEIVREVLDQVVWLYTAWDKPGQATRYRDLLPANRMSAGPTD